MNDEELVRYFPSVETAVITDSIPKAFAALIEGSGEGSSVDLDKVFAGVDVGVEDPVFNVGEVGGAEFMAYVLAGDEIERCMPHVGFMDRWTNSFRQSYGGGVSNDDFTMGLEKYVGDVYSFNVGFDVLEDVHVLDYETGEVSLSVDLRYNPGTDSLDELYLPGELTVSGTVNEGYRDELEPIVTI